MNNTLVLYECSVYERVQNVYEIEAISSFVCSFPDVALLTSLTDTPRHIKLILQATIYFVRFVVHS